MHGHRSRGDKSPEFGVGDANANCPPQILSYRYKKERSKYAKIRFRPRLCPGPRWGAHDAPQPRSRRGRGHPLPYPTLLGTDPPSAIAMRPP